MTDTATMTQEHTELLATLAQHRWFLRHTVRELTDEQAVARPTVSELCLGGLIKHVAGMERAWISFALGDQAAVATDTWGEHEFTMAPGETLTSLLAAYDEVAGRTEEVVAGLPDLNVAYPLPPAPWFPPGASWSIRRVLLHLIAETSQHAGHADILRESLDGAKTMG